MFLRSSRYLLEEIIYRMQNSVSYLLSAAKPSWEAEDVALMHASKRLANLKPVHPLACEQNTKNRTELSAAPDWATFFFLSPVIHCRKGCGDVAPAETWATKDNHKGKNISDAKQFSTLLCCHSQLNCCNLDPWSSTARYLFRRLKFMMTVKPYCFCCSLFYLILHICEGKKKSDVAPHFQWLVCSCRMDVYDCLCCKILSAREIY